MNRKLFIVMFALLVMGLLSGGCGGGHSDVFIPESEKTNPIEEPHNISDDISDDERGNITLPDGVTSEMLNAEYWLSLVDNPQKVLVTVSDILEMNENILNSKTDIVDIEGALEGLSPAKSFEVFSRDLYINGEKIDEKEFLEFLEANLIDLPERVYCVTVKRANLKSWPIEEYLGWSETDPDDEAQLSVLEINSPFVAIQICRYAEKTFYYGQSEYYKGWISEQELAVCSSREEWLDSWKVNDMGEDFIVITQDRVRLEPSLYEPELSELEMMLGARLKLVDIEDIPEKIGEREETWFNHIVYVPTRDESGHYVKKIAMINSKYSVSIGYLPYTQENIAKLALSMVGNRFGWGGMLNSWDASLFIRQLYACFGFKLPTNTSTQRSISYFQEMPETVSEDKQAIIETFPIGTIMYFPGFAMIHMGTVNGIGYFVGDLGVYGKLVGEEYVAKRPYTVVLAPLTINRRNGTTFFDSVDGFIDFTVFAY